MQLYQGDRVVTTVSLRDATRWVRSPAGQAWLRALPISPQTVPRIKSLLVCRRCNKQIIKGQCLCGSPHNPKRVYLVGSRSTCPDILCARRFGHRGLHSWERMVLNSRDPKGEFK